MSEREEKTEKKNTEASNGMTEKKPGFWHNFFGHLRTINNHKRLVRRRCFKMGLYRQGLMHDLSKYSFIEFFTGVKYYRGYRSPIGVEREEKGYSYAWLHHKSHNKHHLDYWVDFKMEKGAPGLVGVPMPDRYIAEMVADRLSACENYHKEKYTQADAYEYYINNSKERSIIHPQTEEKLIRLLEMVKDEGEEATFKYIRENLKTGL